MPTKFEEIIVNPRIFKIILDEFFQDLPGVYGIMPVENPLERLFESSQGFVEFCRKVRSTEDGLRLCIGDDVKHSLEAKNEGKPCIYTCHAGLVNITAPIIVGDELIATIFWGQGRATDKILEENAIKNTNSAESKLGFGSGELRELRAKTPVLSDAQIETVTERLWEVATYVSNLGSSKLDAEKARRDLAYRLFETESLQRILLELSSALYDTATFWKKLESALDRICEIVDASLALFVTCNNDTVGEGVIWQVKSKSVVPRSASNLEHISFTSSVSGAVMQMRPIIGNIQQEQIFINYSESFESLSTEYSQVDKVAIIPVRLDPERIGALILFISKAKDLNKSLDLKDEISLLAQATTQIATVYGNCVLYEKQKELVSIRSDWLENVSHQILAPINGILGHTENLSRYYRIWQKNSPQRIDNTLIAIFELSEWAVRMARNFAWVASGRTYPQELNLRLEDDLPGRLISYARNVQGLARSSGLSRVHTDIESVQQLNGRLVIDVKLFRQAITNLLDNAVKYANPRTDVTISGAISNQFGKIIITNYGVPIFADEIEKIFDRYYRGRAAEQKYPVGSGIGLGAARDIIRLHRGDLVALPSIETPLGWKTTFIITLPLIAKEEK